MAADVADAQMSDIFAHVATTTVSEIRPSVLIRTHLEEQEVQSDSCGCRQGRSVRSTEGLLIMARGR